MCSDDGTVDHMFGSDPKDKKIIARMKTPMSVDRTSRSSNSKNQRFQALTRTSSATGSEQKYPETQESNENQGDVSEILVMKCNHKHSVQARFFNHWQRN